VVGAYAATLYATRGVQDAVGVPFVVGLLVLFVAPLPRVALSWLDDARAPAVLLLALAPLGCALQVVHSPLVHVTAARPAAVIRALVLFAGVASLWGALVFARAKRDVALRVVRLALVASVAVLLSRVAVPSASPKPWIDSWYLQQEAALVLASGKNVYTHVYEQIYPPDLFGYTSHFGYLPLVLFFTAPFRLALGDVRYAYVFADALTAWALYRLAGGRSISGALRGASVRDATAAAAALFFLANPMGGVVVELAWSEPLLVVATAFALLSLRGEGRAAGLCVGLALAAKQTNLLLLPLAWAKRRSPRDVALAALVVFASVLPFLLWDAGAFARSTIVVFGSIPTRTDAFSAWTWLHLRGLTLPGAVALVAAGVPGALSLVRAHRRDMSGTLGAIIAAFWALFLTARQSFLNYHYFVTALLVLLLAWRLGVTEERAGA
jgi:hypothetical protein